MNLSRTFSKLRIQHGFMKNQQHWPLGEHLAYEKNYGARNQQNL